MTTPVDNDPFDEPGALSAIKFSQHEGQLLLVTPHELQRNFDRMDGPGDVVIADIVVLDYPGGPIEYTGTVIFPKMIIGQVRRNVGKGRSNLGRVGKGEAQPKQSPPWILLPPTEADKQTARAYLANPSPRSAQRVLYGGGAGGGVVRGAGEAPPF